MRTLMREIERKEEKSEVEWELLKRDKALSLIGEICVRVSKCELSEEEAFQKIREALSDVRG